MSVYSKNLPVHIYKDTISLLQKVDSLVLEFWNWKKFESISSFISMQDKTFSLAMQHCI